MKALLINVPQDAADLFFNGETNHLPCSQIPDLAHVLHPLVIVCAGEETLGFGDYETANVRNKPFTNSKADLYGFNVAWGVSNAYRYERPKNIADCFMLAMLDSAQGSYPLSIKHNQTEVIGNIHDNPEILEADGCT